MDPADSRVVPVEEPFGFAVIAAMIAGACTFLNVYCTQPLLPLFQKMFHATEVQVSLTVGAVTLSVAITAPVIGAAGGNHRAKEGHRPGAFRDGGSDAAGSHRA